MKKLYGLIGHPLSHSLSPKIHQKLFELSSNKTVIYKLIDILPSNFSTFIDNNHNLDGFNVTIPYKIKMFEKLKQLDITAKKYGCVNTVNKEPDGAYKGYNTDILGLLKSINSEGISLNKKVLLLGCGGVGRMVAIETISQKGNLTIAVKNSSIPKAQKLKAEIIQKYVSANIDIVNIKKIPNVYFDVLINATPSGMFPKINQMPICPKVCSKVSAIFDLIYNPNETMLMKAGKSYGSKIIGGMEMLVWQAAYAQQIWNNTTFHEADIKHLINEMKNKAI